MNKNEFFLELKSVLEAEDVELKENTVLRDLEQYDSLAILGIIAFIDEKFNKRLSAENFGKVTSVQSLMTLIGEERFEENG